MQGTGRLFSALATGTSAYGTTVFYQWQDGPKGSTTWTNIPGATAATFADAILALWRIAARSIG